MSLTKKLRVFLLVWIVLIIFWFPYFLAFYPGIFAYDVTIQWLEYWTSNFRTWHPIIHTLLMGTGFRIGRRLLGDYQKGIAFYCLIQMLFVSGVISYTFCSFKKYMNKAAAVCITVFFAIFPVFPIMSISTTKDVIFASLFLVLIVQIDKCIHDERKGVLGYIPLVIISAAAIMFRNNQSYALIVFFGIEFLAFIYMSAKKKKIKYHFLAVTAALGVSLILGLACNAALKTAVKASDGPIVEALSVPCQQIAGTYARNGSEMEDEILDEIYLFWDEEDLQTYLPQISDPIKFSLDQEAYLENKSDFFRLWLKLGTKYPASYIKAFFDTIQPMWNPLDRSITSVHGCYIETYCHEPDAMGRLEGVELSIGRDSKLPVLEELITGFIGEGRVLNVPVLALLFRPASYFWITVVLFIIAIMKRKNSFIQISLLISYWFTMALGPCVIPRYCLNVMVVLPFLLAKACSQKR